MDTHGPVTRQTIAALIQQRLEAVRESISRELCAIPTPIAGCDVHCNRLLEDRSKVVDELQRFARLRQQAPAPADLVAFAQRCEWLDQPTLQSVMRHAAAGASI